MPTGTIARLLIDKGYWSRMKIAPGYASVLAEARSKAAA